MVGGVGGIWVYSHWVYGDNTVTLTNSIIANSQGGANCDGTIIDGGNNFADDDTCGPGLSDITPGVDFDTSLADNGGQTLTHALLPGSVAIDAAGVCGLDTDQRGFLRWDGTCDSGSYEYGALDPDSDDEGDDTDEDADEDNDGTGEFGVFGELSADDNVRGTTSTISPSVLSGAFKAVDGDGEVSRSGYLFQIFLPNDAGLGIPEDDGGGISKDRRILGGFVVALRNAGDDNPEGLPEVVGCGTDQVSDVFYEDQPDTR